MYKSKNLLSISADAKTIKGTKKGVLTGILYFAPHTLSGNQVCPKATPECKALCLYTAGRGIYTKVQTGRLNKTKWFFTERETFLAQLVKNIEALERKAKRLKMIPAIRLNGTSDIAWEKIAVTRNGKTYPSIYEAFPKIKGYEYTKILGRKKALALPNCHLTFSLSENNDKEALQALEQGYNVAVVMKVRPKDKKPKLWSGYPVINGDENDLRFLDKKGGHIIALSAKGKARKADLGFVRDINSSFKINKL